MISRNSIQFRQVFACLPRPEIRSVSPRTSARFGFVISWLRGFSLVAGGEIAGLKNRPDFAAANRVDFPFLLPCETLNLHVIKILTRGFAVCVKRPFFLRQPPLWPLLAALATLIRQPITLPCARSVAQLLVRLSPMQPVAAKPKARLLARLPVSVRAIFLALQAAPTKVGSKLGLTASLKSDSSNSTRPFGVTPRVAFLFFRALRAHPRKGCYV
jgi:hypothetical protein